MYSLSNVAVVRDSDVRRKHDSFLDFGVWLFVIHRGQCEGCECRESAPRCLFVCLFREVSMEVVDAERATRMFVCLFREVSVDIGCRESTKMFVCLFREVIMEVVDAERALQDQVAAAERREREERVATDLLQSLVDSTVDEQMSQIIQKEVE